MQTSSLPEHWFRDVKSIHVVESVDYYTRKGSTAIIIHYKPWWKFRRKLKFKRTRTIHNEAETHMRAPEAQALINKFKVCLRPASKGGLFDLDVPKLGPQGDFAFFYRHTHTPMSGHAKNSPLVRWEFDI